METTKQNLLRQSPALSVSKTQSMQVSAVTLADELKLTGLNAKSDVDDRLVSEFSRSLLDFPVEAIQSAFRNWRDASPFFPAISEIREQCQMWVMKKAEAQEQEEQAQRRREIELARERGELIEWPDVLKKFSEICERGTVQKLEKKMPIVPPERTDAEIADRQEILRQQAEYLKAKYGKP